MVALVWTLVLGFAAGRYRTLAQLRRQFERSAGQTIEGSSFYDRLNASLAKLMRAAVAMVLRSAQHAERALRGPLVEFADVLLIDSTVVRLHDLLARAFPVCRTTISRPPSKAHVILGVRGCGDHTVKVTSERAHDGPVFQVGP